MLRVVAASLPLRVVTLPHLRSPSPRIRLAQRVVLGAVDLWQGYRLLLQISELRLLLMGVNCSHQFLWVENYLVFVTLPQPSKVLRELVLEPRDWHVVGRVGRLLVRAVGIVEVLNVLNDLRFLQLLFAFLFLYFFWLQTLRLSDLLVVRLSKSLFYVLRSDWWA